MGEADIIKAITELGQTLRAEVLEEIRTVRHELQSFRLMVEEDSLAESRDRASIRRRLFDHEKAIEELRKKAG